MAAPAYFNQLFICNTEIIKGYIKRRIWFRRARIEPECVFHTLDDNAVAGN